MAGELRCYRRFDTGAPVIGDGADIRLLSPADARALAEELVAAADRCDRGEFDL